MILDLKNIAFGNNHICWIEDLCSGNTNTVVDDVVTVDVVVHDDVIASLIFVVFGVVAVVVVV